jgi:hypothetical protein
MNNANRKMWLLALLLTLISCACASDKRAPAVAGSFYPASATELQTTVDRLLARATPPAISDPIVALISPHAGYPYAGAVAAQGYALLKGRHYERVIIIAPSHYDAFGFASIYDGNAYLTPLGAVPVDKEFAAKLAKLSPQIKFSARGHAPVGQQGEHALEVQLPFLQRALGQFKLVPIIMGEQNYDLCRALGVALAKAIQGTDTLIVASSDLSHFHPYDDAVKMDTKFLNAVQQWDYLSLSRNLDSRTWEACGGGPIIAAMIAAERLGATEARLLKYANSGDVAPPRDRVVGYGALALLRAPAQQVKAKPYALTTKEKQELLKIARQAVETAVRARKTYEPPAPQSAALLEERGAFVTLNERGQLRGCIGYGSASKPLYLTVRDVAIFAAVRDTRFPPVTAAELNKLEYEVSVLSPFRHVREVKEIQVGRHGLVLRKGYNEGYLLPQVPVEQRWDRATFLDQIALKAGLPRNAWKDDDADLFLFTALVFGDHKLSDEQDPPARPKDQLPPPGRDSRPQ